jgi:hypothetical protein
MRIATMKLVFVYCVTLAFIVNGVGGSRSKTQSYSSNYSYALFVAVVGVESRIILVLVD